MKTIEVTVYNFSELSPKVQEKVLDRYRQWEVQDDYWHGYIIDTWKEKLEAIGFLEPEISFSGFYSQGDGAFFTAKCDAIKLLDNMLMCSTLHEFNYFELKRMACFAKNRLLDIYIHRYDHHYSHENVGNLHIGFNGHNTGKQTALISRLKEALNDLRKDLCDQIYSDLQSEYEYRTSDEYLIESYLTDDSESELFFYENGKSA